MRHDDYRIKNATEFRYTGPVRGTVVCVDRLIQAGCQLNTQDTGWTHHYTVASVGDM